MPLSPGASRRTSHDLSDEDRTLLDRPIVPRRALVGIAALILVVAGAGGGWYLYAIFHHSGTGGDNTVPPRPDGPTFYQVLAKTNDSVENVGGGPWSLFSVIGIASPSPFSPDVKGYLTLNRTVSSCDKYLDGVTLWNGSIPLFNGTPDSGTAPFWQLAFYSNTSNEVLITTSVSGAVHVYLPIPMISNCTLAWPDFRAHPNYWSQMIYVNSSLPVNSVVAASMAWNETDRGWIATNLPLAEVLVLGPAIFKTTGDVAGGTWTDYFMGCGVARIPATTGWGLLYSAQVGRTGLGLGVINGSTNCALLNSGLPPLEGKYGFLFSNSSSANDSASSWTTSTFQVEMAYLNGTVFSYDGWGVADWMVSLNLTSSTGDPLQVGGSGCPNWVPSIADCSSNESGWYVVLLSAVGGWQASYGVADSTSGWSVAVTGMVSNESLVVVVPTWWDLSGCTLTVASTVSTSSISGTLLL